MPLRSTFLFCVLAAVAVTARTFSGAQIALEEVSSPVDALAHRIQELSLTYADPVELYKAVDPAGAADLDEPRLFRVPGLEGAMWLTEGDKLRLRRQGVKFVDITETQDLGMRNSARLQSTAAATYPEISYRSRVKGVISKLSTDNMLDVLETMTGFYNRYYKSDNGQKASDWLFDKILNIVKESGSSSSLWIQEFKHSWPQSSIIAHFQPVNRADYNATVIIGAHLDSINQWFPLLRAPGADDDASGTVTILEAFRSLLASNFTPLYPVEFHWYAAEEGGSLGSRDVAAAYELQGRDVRGMLQYDMTAYVKRGTTPTLTMITSDVDPKLTGYGLTLAKEYTNIPVQGRDLFAGAGSDHMSWGAAGYPAACATEADPKTLGDPYMHTANDKIDIPNGEFNIEHARDLSKLAVAFAVELGGWA
ncbi:Zn-dependent exopeptidase [Neolentinus lepideus HHB14362 ss-1]|uniref:Peptide hydrolase n=1 Tax=Neolentinus lepideus HHB14362 ss-1 TaxID=1314782 RepID=A0A165TZI6_9AGAM|nr:Zn-dependent exopeptidase [Neolentinus lepideus HHB14362 ss-1]